MIVYSVEYRQGRSEIVKREWFETERQANVWVHSDDTMRGRRSVIGPKKHVIEGRSGLVSFLRTYRGGSQGDQKLMPLPKKLAPPPGVRPAPLPAPKK
jgi:hypothetical protein